MSDKTSLDDPSAECEIASGQGIESTRKRACSAPSKLATKNVKKNKLDPLLADETKITSSTETKMERMSPTLTEVLSQYEMLKVIAANISTADLANLAASNKTLRCHIKNSDIHYAQYKASTICSGKGIVSRAHMFKHWNGDETKADVKCAVSECKPCCKCDAMVCQYCRYHVKYFDSRLDCRNCPNRYAHYEKTAATKAWNKHTDARLNKVTLDTSNIPIETKKALYITSSGREKRYCRDCRPREDFSASEWYNDAIQMETDLEIAAYCDCAVRSRFMKELPWLCVPCVLDMEKELAAREVARQAYEVTMDDPDSDNYVCEYDGPVFLCDCGKRAIVNDVVKCRWCNELVELPEGEFNELEEARPDSYNPSWEVWYARERRLRGLD